MVWVGQELKDHLVPTPCPAVGRDVFHSLGLKLSKNGKSTAAFVVLLQTAPVLGDLPLISLFCFR